MFKFCNAPNIQCQRAFAVEHSHGLDWQDGLGSTALEHIDHQHSQNENKSTYQNEMIASEFDQLRHGN